MSNKYDNTVFYKIVCKDEHIKDLYVGHTTDFNKRARQHKNNCCRANYNSYNLNVYKFIRAYGGFDNFNIVIIEESSCEKKRDAEQHEGYFVNMRSYFEW